MKKVLFCNNSKANAPGKSFKPVVVKFGTKVDQSEQKKNKVSLSSFIILTLAKRTSFSNRRRLSLRAASANGAIALLLERGVDLRPDAEGLRNQMDIFNF